MTDRLARRDPGSPSNAPTGRAGHCPLCAGPPVGAAFPFAQSWQNTLYHHLKCGVCGATFIDPVPDLSTLRDVYTWANYHARHYSLPTAGRFTRQLSLMKSYAPAAESLLDFGCGAGEFLQLAAAEGLCCHGVEFEATTIEQVARRSGIPVSTLDAVEASGRAFDVVHMNDVLHHLIEPAGALRRLERVLSPGGLLVISGPLESNPSLVFWAAAGSKHLRQLLGSEPEWPVVPPTMLVRAHQRAQRRFFAHRLGYVERHFEVYETGWPYRGARRAGLRGPGMVTKELLGGAAVAMSRVGSVIRLSLGNRFTGVFTPTVSEMPSGAES